MSGLQVDHPRDTNDDGRFDLLVRAQRAVINGVEREATVAVSDGTIVAIGRLEEP